jgi:formylglycine-generating enzyme required for sulfatase activity
MSTLVLRAFVWAGAGVVAASALGQDSRTPLDKTYKSKSIDLEMVLIEPGEFMMGSPETEMDRSEDEVLHRVRIRKAFYVGKYEVTQGQFARVMGFNPSWFSPGRPGEDEVARKDTLRLPVESVTWFDAAEFSNRLSERDGLKPYFRLANVRKDGDTISSADLTVVGGGGYRLLTEAEWEYACRSGTTTPFHFGGTSNGMESNVDGRLPYGTTEKGPYIRRPTTVGSYRPNRWDLYDMHGNVQEWCLDWYVKDYASLGTDDPVNLVKAEYRVLRGGSWISPCGGSSSAGREWISPDDARTTVGFRVARTPER